MNISISTSTVTRNFLLLKRTFDNQYFHYLAEFLSINMSDEAVEAAASALYQKVEKEHRKHSTTVKPQKKYSTGSRQAQKKISSTGRQHPVLQEQCNCDHIKAEIEASKKSSMMVKNEIGDDKRFKRREAVAEKNETERILTKETLKVLSKKSSVGSM